jgi:hypothetical protein
MTLRVSLIIDGLWDGAKKALAGTSAGIKQVEADAKKLPAVNPFQSFDEGAQKATTTLGSQRMMFKALAREAALVGGPLAGMIGEVGTLTIGTGRLGLAMTAGAITVAAIVATVYKAVTAFSELEQHQVKVATSLAATRNASGQTVASLDDLTRELSKSGTQSVADVREVELAVLRFKSVSMDAFPAVLKVARDIAATGFVSMKDAATGLAKAIADPANALQHFKDIGASLSVDQQRLAKDFAATGQSAKAAQVLIAAASAQFAGADAKAADTLGGAWGRLTRSGGSFSESLGKDIVQATNLKGVMDGLAIATERFNAARAKAPAMGNPLTLPFRIGASIARQIADAADITPPSMKKADRPSRGGRVFADGIGTEFEAMQKDIAASQADTAERKRRTDAIKGVVDALEEEARTAGLNANQKKIYEEQQKALVLSEDELKNGLLGTSDAARKVASAVNEVAAKGFMRQVTDQFIQQNSALRAQAASVDMALGPAEAYRKEQELLARAESEGITLDAARIAKLREKSATYGTLAEAAARAKLASDISFERKTLFLSDEDVAIATRLRDLYKNDIPGALASTEAAQLRVNYAFKSLKDSSTELTSSFAKDFRNEMQNGATAADALRKAGSNALNTISDKLIDMASKKLWESAFGGSSAGGGLFGLLGKMMGGTATVSDPTFGGFSLPGTNAAAAKFDEGGYTGNLSRYAVAGVVHGGEFVMDADTTARHLPLLKALHEGRLPGYAEGGYVGVMPPLRVGTSGGGGAPVVHIHPAAPGETFDVKQNSDGSIALVGRMIDERLDAFSSRSLPTLVHQALADPRGR